MKLKSLLKPPIADIFILLLMAFILFLSPPHFEESLSDVLLDRHGNLLSARVSEDEQWRFPSPDSVPSKIATCILQFEDEYFYYHPGLNPVSLIRATYQNVKSRSVVSGASTISMQVIRLNRKNRSRTIFEKFIEIILALRMEASFSKEKILNLYATYAPFGGNVVGIEAASWRYYGRPSHLLSWGESAALAVLPNAPSIVYPGKSSTTYLKKRNRLLDKLWQNEIIDSLTCVLSKMEELPSEPKALPNYAPHLLQTVSKNTAEGRIHKTTLNGDYQKRYGELVNRYHRLYHQKEVHNAAVLIIDNESNEVITYVGNTYCNRPNSGSRVDIVRANRSTGSLLKPFLYAAALDDGRITRKSLLADIPTEIAGFAPKNFNKQFMGAVQAEDALTRSLNVPSVLLLQNYGLEKFDHLLQELNLNSINKGPDHYGLSIILGGAESNLYELTTAYANLMNSITNFNSTHTYHKNAFDSIPYLQKEVSEELESEESAAISAGAISVIFNVLTQLKRPGMEGDWKMFESSIEVAWKTGTSYGFRDAWSIGTTKKYTVGVWVGNASGEGRPTLVGLEMAAPIMFEIFSSLNNTDWYQMPYEDLKLINICAKSGDLYTENCASLDSVDHPYYGVENLKECKYHRIVHLDKSRKFQVSSKCYSVAEMIHEPWFVLPPGMEWFYTKHHPDYIRLPPFMEGCGGEMHEGIQIIYPRDNTEVRIPIDLNGEPGMVVFEAAHQLNEAPIHWHLDNEYLITTSQAHQMEFLPSLGNHVLTLVDNYGNSKQVNFRVVE